MEYRTGPPSETDISEDTADFKVRPPAPVRPAEMKAAEIYRHLG